VAVSPTVAQSLRITVIDVDQGAATLLSPRQAGRC
jgi:hypothetical protein